MVSMSRTPGSLKCFRFRPKARALPLAGKRYPSQQIWTLTVIVLPRAEEPLCGTYELLLPSDVLGNDGPERRGGRPDHRGGSRRR